MEHLTVYQKTPVIYQHKDATLILNSLRRFITLVSRNEITEFQHLTFFGDGSLWS